MLTTARLSIRPFTLDDVADATAAVGLLRDTDAGNRDWIRRRCIDHQRLHGYAYWQCRDLETDRLVGFCGWQEDDLETSLGCAIAAPDRGRGLATEAARAVVARGVANLDATRLHASVRPPHPASCAVLVRAGMTLVRAYVDDRGPRLVYAPAGR